MFCRSSGVLVCCALTLARISQAWLIPSWWTSCYDDPPIGCFPTTYPYNNTAGIGPQDPETIGVEFYFFNSGEFRQLFNIYNADQILQNSYNASAKTVVIIHGYFENGFASWIRQLGNALLQKDRHMNVIVTNWDGGSTNLIYFQSVANGRIAGAITALLLKKLISLGGVKSDFHVIGFSLGAHVAGHVGSHLPGIGRITGLDPARPGFEYVPPESRLDPTDAVLVDVIHTDTTPTAGMGTSQPMGTVDFYPNGGVNQPGCPVSMMERVSAFMYLFDFTSDSIRSAVGCSHIRVTSIFSASITNNCSYITHRCRTLSELEANDCIPCEPHACPQMGYNVDMPTVGHQPGLYRTDTTGSFPYC